MVIFAFPFSKFVVTPCWRTWHTDLILTGGARNSAVLWLVRRESSLLLKKDSMHKHTIFKCPINGVRDSEHSSLFCFGVKMTACDHFQWTISKVRRSFLSGEEEIERNNNPPFNSLSVVKQVGTCLHRWRTVLMVISVCWKCSVDLQNEDQSKLLCGPHKDRQTTAHTHLQPACCHGNSNQECVCVFSWF